MIFDAQELSGNNPMQTQICVVGGGMVGITMALELSAAGLEVLVLEAGGTRKTEASQSHYRGSVVNEDLHGPLETFRWRRLGGTSGVWNGRCVPYDPIDFEDRPWMQECRWPIGYEEVAPYFAAANRYLEAGDADYSASSTFGPGMPEMIEGFCGEDFSTDAMERFSPPTDMGVRYRERLAASGSIRVVLRAPLQEIVLDESGTRVDRLEARRPDGSLFAVEAKQVVLAAGGLETVRLLLANNRVQKNGIGNEQGVVGRFYMSHIAGTMGSFAPRGEVHNGYRQDYDGVFCRPRLALLPGAQRQHQVGQFIARLHHTRISDPAHGSGILSALRLGRTLVPKQWRARLIDEKNSAGEMAAHLWNVARDLPEVARFGKQLVFERKLADRKYPSVVVKPRSRRYSLDFHAEQEPNWLSVVRLGTERDEFGMPRLEVDWRYTAMDVRTIEVAAALFAEDVQRSGAGVFDYVPESILKEMTRYGAYGGHHLGTTRMGADPRTSVVDAACRVHDMSNLFVAGGSVLPTSSQANPTLTVIALALRLADLLKGNSV